MNYVICFCDVYSIYIAQISINFSNQVSQFSSVNFFESILLACFSRCHNSNDFLKHKFLFFCSFHCLVDFNIFPICIYLIYGRTNIYNHLRINAFTQLHLIITSFYPLHHLHLKCKKPHIFPNGSCWSQRFSSLNSSRLLFIQMGCILCLQPLIRLALLSTELLKK